MKKIFILLLIFPSVGFSAPAIDTATGTFSNGGSITITGTGFGASGPNVVLFDSFENGTTGSNISTTSNSADIGNWNELGNPSQTYSSDYAKAGAKSMKINWSISYGAGPKLQYTNVQNSDILISWWQYMPTNRDIPGTNGEGANWKLFWIGDETDDWPWGSDIASQFLSSDLTSATFPAAVDDLGLPSRYGNEYEPDAYYDTLFSKGVWMRTMVALRNSSSGSTMWQQEINGASQSTEIRYNKITAHTDDPWNVLTLPGFGRQDNNAVAYFDDVYVATGAGARARVEIGNASTYTACTNLAIITPTLWSDTSITATVRSGSFSSGTAYLYVTDLSGVTGPAKTITIGAAAPSGAKTAIGAGSIQIGVGATPISLQ